MVLSNLSFRTATKHVRNFRIEVGLIWRREQVVDETDADALLQVAIEAYEWLIRADLCVRQLEREDRIDVSQLQKADHAIRTMCHAWLQSAGSVQQWIARNLKSDSPPKKLPSFTRCQDEMNAILESGDLPGEIELPDALANARDQALDEYRNGETSEFFSDTESNGSSVS